MARLVFLLALLALPIAALHAQAAPAPITEDSLRAHIAALADDAMEGREPGTAGEAMAAEYIARQFAASGLAPFNGESFYQPVLIVHRAAVSANAGWSREGERDALGPDEIGLLGHDTPQRVADAAMIFAGFGGPETETTDVAGAVVFIFSRMPPGEGALSYGERKRRLVERGALGVIALHDPERSADYAVQAMRDGRTSLASVPAPAIDGALSALGSNRLLALAGLRPEEALRASSQPDFVPVALDYRFDAEVTTAIETPTAYNVIARLEGTGSRDETVLMMAHYDHLGICRPEGEADRICNGAVDNASGVAILLETARVLAAGPRPVRDVLFVATTAEEMGLLGARALVEPPIVPIASIVAALNLDTVAIVPSGMPVAILGRGRTPLDPVVDAVTREVGREVDSDLEADAFLQRQDGWALMEAGVPSIMAGGSFSDMARLMTYIEGPYHAPNDDLANLPGLGGALDDANLHVALVRALADPARYARERALEVPGAADPATNIAEAANGLVAVVEDDAGADARVIGIRAEGCSLFVDTDARDRTVDLAAIDGVVMDDPSFIYIADGPNSFAIVGDAESLAQLGKLLELARAMAALHDRCAAEPAASGE